MIFFVKDYFIHTMPDTIELIFALTISKYLLKRWENV